LQHGAHLDFALVPGEHDFFPDQVMRASNATVLAAENHIRGVLKKRRHRHNGLALDACHHQICITHCKLCPPAEHLGQRGHASVAGLHDDVQALVPVKAPGLRGVVACKLELVQPLELQGDPFQRLAAYGLRCSRCGVQHPR
jgi:hypothetical protein